MRPVSVLLFRYITPVVGMADAAGTELRKPFGGCLHSIIQCTRNSGVYWTQGQSNRECLTLLLLCVLIKQFDFFRKKHRIER